MLLTKISNGPRMKDLLPEVFGGYLIHPQLQLWHVNWW